jgi:hypothetical protein
MRIPVAVAALFLTGVLAGCGPDIDKPRSLFDSLDLPAGTRSEIVGEHGPEFNGVTGTLTFPSATEALSFRPGREWAPLTDSVWTTPDPDGDPEKTCEMNVVERDGNVWTVYLECDLY